ncbi:MAG: family 20 glycosylhydrolase [Bacteroidota bacterium]
MRKWLFLFVLPLLCTCGRAPEKAIRYGQVAILPRPQELVREEGYFFMEPDWSAGITGYNDSTFHPEGYELRITPRTIVSTAATEAGHFYAFQSFKQLLPVDSMEANTKLAVPCLTIKDEPAHAWRGFMLDVSRHFFTVDQVKEVLDIAASQKLNRFHWHLTDDQGWRIEIKSRPKLTEIGAWRADRTNTDETISDWWGRAPLQPGEEPTYGGFYTQEEIREVVTYAKERYIEIIPEIDLPGHAQAAVAAYPEIGAVNTQPAVATGGVFKNNTVNPGREATYRFVEDVLNEVMDLFPYDYVHIGGDECNKSQWKVDPDAQRKMREEGLASEEELQSYFIERMEQIINARGKKMIGWDEILEGGLAPNATVMSWRGEAGGIAAVEAGHEVIMTPNKYCYLDLKQGHDDLEPNLGYSRLLLSTAYNYQVIPDGLTPEQARLIKGIQANMWTESISDWDKFTYMLYPRLYAVAENAWTRPERKDWQDFTDRVRYAFRRLDTDGVRYATSAFSPWIHHRQKDGRLEVWLETEADGLEVYYTLDGTPPDTNATLYETPFPLAADQRVTARAFLNGVAVGYPASLDLPVHQAFGAKVTDQRGRQHPELTDFQYGRLTTADSNWVRLPHDPTLTVTFAQPIKARSLRLSTLRFSILGVYPPQEIEVWGRAPGGTFVSLGTLLQDELAVAQGRNKIPSQLIFPETELTELRIKLRAFAEIPAGHHRAGEAAKIYLDELVVE